MLRYPTPRNTGSAPGETFLPEYEIPEADPIEHQYWRDGISGVTVSFSTFSVASGYRSKDSTGTFLKSC